jgi:AcrR family transcriptional regulator
MTASTSDTAKPLRRDAAENRERLLAAAQQVFAEHGLEAGVEEVARVAGVGMGTLYRRFPSKQALIDDLVGGLRHDLWLAAQQAAEHTDGTGLEVLLVRAAELQEAQPGCLLLLWAESDAGLDAVEKFRAMLADLLRSAQQHQRVRAELTPPDISLVLLSVSYIIATAGPVARAAWRRHLELLIAGLRPADTEFEPALREEPLSGAQWLEIVAARRH